MESKLKKVNDDGTSEDPKKTIGKLLSFILALFVFPVSFVQFVIYSFQILFHLLVVLVPLLTNVKSIETISTV